jgi:glycosyltransferase involved in cell wall biosynthesis
VRPRVSIVTSSFNQGHFIGRTIDSIRAQDYPDIEHIVVDGMSTDDTVDVLARYPHLKVIREPDRGQADAINKGFRIASGAILGFLNSDDLLEPGAITAVVSAIDPAAGRHVVMGRCLFIDEHDRPLGVEHPSAFESHRRVLEIWKGHWLPQPSTFWTREAWEQSGPLNIEEQLLLDYDLFCRMSRDFAFHRIDRVLSRYRLHTQSKTRSVSDADRLEQAIAVSRRYWGKPSSLMYWQIQASYCRYRLDRRARAVRMMQSGRALRRQGRRVAGTVQLLSGGLLAPDVVADVVVMPVLMPAARRLLGRPRRAKRRPISPQTQAYLSGAELFPDNWAGPTVIVARELNATHTHLVLEAALPSWTLSTPLSIEAHISGRSLGVQPAGTNKRFRLVWPLKDVLPGAHQVQLNANGFVVPHDMLGTHDYRPLSYHVEALGFAALTTPDSTPFETDERTARLQQLVESIANLPDDWHGAGTVGRNVLLAIVHHARALGVIQNSVETGSGKTTLLLSHLSNNHRVFAVDAGQSISRVKSSPLLAENTVTYVEGPTQRTLPKFEFVDRYQLVLLDGPHGYPFPDLEYYYLYPALDTGGLLIIDDIRIPSVGRMFDIIAADDMFETLEVVDGNTAFLRRTDAPLVDPESDGWWLQGYNASYYTAITGRTPDARK